MFFLLVFSKLMFYSIFLSRTDYIFTLLRGASYFLPIGSTSPLGRIVDEGQAFARSLLISHAIMRCGFSSISRRLQHTLLHEETPLLLSYFIILNLIIESEAADAIKLNLPV